ncbi:PREDICTED: annexin D6-like [Nelumbo nucifera]|uniref:Annexin D6-like n=2 Tax=Nelumbo nucifera TaxID=4432 RepID=A0A1U8A834_NELNU|nr:PREDICTED: annexin D6-like [Nelumbo nucifera]DAD40293.1 TPA_asm: hypothetical protein HUJ06_014616 [Nelumbo nucifera]
MDYSTQISRKYEQDCQHLHCCFSGNGVTKDGKLIEILTHRNFQEYKLIRQTYIALYNQDLLHFLFTSQRNNPSSRLVYLRMSEPQERDAEIVRFALFGGDVDLSTLTEIVCTRPSKDLHSIKQAYRPRYNSDLEHDVSLKIGGGFREILLAFLRSSHHYSGKVDMSMAMCDAKTLYEAMESGKSVDERTIITLLSQRNVEQIKAILISYKQLYGHEFSKSLKRNKCGNFGKELRIAIRSMQYPEKYFAKQLRRTWKNNGTQEVLIRTIVTRSGIDIGDINNTFIAKTGWSLENLIRREFKPTGRNSKTDGALGLVVECLIGLVNGC